VTFKLEWTPYNEKKPFGHTDAVVTKDNEYYSKKRVEAYAAAQRGQASPEQMLLIEDTDRVMAEAVANRRIREVR
jgi:hypothetical protein